MKLGLFTNLAALASCGALLLASARCSPNAPSITKSMLADINAAKGPIPAPDNGGTKPKPTEITLETSLLNDDHFSAEVALLMTDNDFGLLLGKNLPGEQNSTDKRFPLLGTSDQFSDFLKNSKVALELPAGIQVPEHGASAYLSVSLTDEIASIKREDFGLALRQSEADDRHWTLFIPEKFPDKTVQNVLDHLSELAILLPQPTPSPSPSASPSNSPVPSPTPATTSTTTSTTTSGPTPTGASAGVTSTDQSTLD